MKLEVGMLAPEFETKDIFGNRVAPQSHGGKLLLLSFFRNAACALCNLQIHHLIQRYPAYHSQGLDIIAVFESRRDSILAYVSRQSAPFPIVADPQAVLYDLYGVETSEEKVMAPVDEAWRAAMVRDAEALGYPLTHEEGSNFFRLPADFLIGPDRRILSALYSSAVGEHIAFETIDDALAHAA